MSSERTAPHADSRGGYHLLDARSYADGLVSVQWAVTTGDGVVWIHEATSSSISRHECFCLGIYTLLDLVDVLADDPMAVRALERWTPPASTEGGGK